MRCIHAFGLLAAAVLLIASGCTTGRVTLNPGVQENQPVNVVPFGQITKWEENGRDYGVMWEDARDIFRVVVNFASDSAPPRPQDVRLEYWHWKESWPQRRIPRDKPSGSGGSGWLDIGDWFQGQWRQADVNLDAKGHTFTYTFKPVNAKEFPDLKDFPAEYRSTMKLRLVSNAPLNRVVSFQAFTDSVWKPLDFEVEWGGNAKKTEQDWSGRIEIFNGHLRELTTTSNLTKLHREKMAGVAGWKSTVKNRADGISASILYAQPKASNSFDETIVTIRTAAESFSFAASDLIREKHIFIPDFGVLVRTRGLPLTYPMAHKRWLRDRESEPTMDLYSRVMRMPEQTFTRAWADTPAKRPQYIPLSFEGGRQHFRLNANGSVTANRNWIMRIEGLDTPRCKWDGEEITYSFGQPGAVKSRTLVDGCLPMTVSEWEKDGVRYKQTAFVMPLDGLPKAGKRIHADDTLVFISRIEMQKIADTAEGKLTLAISTGGKNENLVLRGDGLIYGGPRGTVGRMWAFPRSGNDRVNIQYKGDRIIYRVPFGEKDRTFSMDLCIPFVEICSQEIPRFKSLSFDDAFTSIRSYWESRIAAGTQIVTPEPMINDFYKAHVSHLLINTEREVGGADRYMPKVGTFSYGVYSNESCMMVSDLDRRGYNDVAQRSLDAWLHYQGTVGLPGDFSSKDGVFYGDGGYEMGEYNQHHGWVLWAMGEHYWYTRDKAWLLQAAPKIVKGCEWVIEQRQRTIDEASRTPIRAIEKGLLPPGRLEDIGDWRCWLSTNVFTWWGMDNVARALESAGHPEGKRLVAEANAYHKDLMAAFTEAMVRSPVVKLRDGSWIPKVPSDVHRRGRSFGWITETLEGSIHLVRCGAIEADSRLATWIIKDFEDNLYLSDQFGYQLPPDQFEKRWFSHGGVSQQANLLHNSIPFLLRDQPAHYLRAYFNAFAVSYFPDTRMMTEHALPNIGDWRGDHYKSSDESQSTYWLRLMFVEERGDELWLGPAIPRYWLADGKKIGITNAQTYFGPMSMQMESNVAAGKITMTIDPPTRNVPKLIRARFRHPERAAIARCEVNGRPYAKFDPKKEWVELPECTGRTIVIVYYDKP